MPRILICGGGSGGHVAPAVAVAEALQEKEFEAIIAHSTRRIDQQILLETSFSCEVLSAAPLKTSPLGLLKFSSGFLRTVVETSNLIRKHAACCVVTTGGFVAAPALFAARRMSVPTILLNIDKPPGKANRLARRWADVVLSTVDWNNVGATRIPPPIRICTIACDDQNTCKASFGLDPSKMTLLVTGASQGASTINELVPELVLRSPKQFQNWQILHLAGADHVDEVEQAYRQTSIFHVVHEFTNRMGDAWGAADLAITRGGANTIAEISCNAVPSIVLPYPYHKDDHQRTNAQHLAEIGGILIETDYKSLSANLDHAGKSIIQLLANHQKRFEMQQAISIDTPLNGASFIADTVVSLL